MLHISWSAVWIGIIIVAFIVEVITVGLTTVWFACGALCAYAAQCYGATVNTQIMMFLLISFGLEYFLRPYCVKLLCRRKSARHIEALTGRSVRVIAEVDNTKGEGRVLVDHMEWRARSKRDEYVFSPGDTAVIDHIEDIVLILVPDTPINNLMAES